jgi:hypothetical protein
MSDIQKEQLKFVKGYAKGLGVKCYHDKVKGWILYNPKNK